MLTIDANIRLCDAHNAAGYDWKEIFSATDVLSSCAPLEVQRVWKSVRSKGTASSFFETWCTSWSNSSEISTSFWIESSSRMIISACAIAHLDRVVDFGGSGKAIDSGILEAAGLWDSYVISAFPRPQLWVPLLPKWLLPAHGATSCSTRSELLLTKNPFYPAAMRTCGVSEGSDQVREDFAVALGLLDDAADVLEDALAGSPNALFPASSSFFWRGDIRDLQQDILASGAIDLSVLDAKSLLSRVADEASEMGCRLLSFTAKEILESLENYADFCTIRAIAAQKSW